MPHDGAMRDVMPLDGAVLDSSVLDSSLYGGSPLPWIGLLVLVGLMGIVVPVLPGLILIWGAVALWALITATPTAWVVLAVVTLIVVVGTAIRYLLPERQLRASGVPWTTSAAGVVAGIVGFFVIPVVGLFVGFVLGVYVAERLRLHSHASAWASSVTALKVAGLSALIELVTGVTAAAVWLVAALTVG
jgi:uncharacterized protein